MKQIIRKPGTLNGRPIFAGTRIPADLILDFLAEGWSEADILESYPRLTQQDLQGLYKYMSQKMKEEKYHPLSI